MAKVSTSMVEVPVTTVKKVEEITLKLTRKEAEVVFYALHSLARGYYEDGSGQVPIVDLTDSIRCATGIAWKDKAYMELTRICPVSAITKYPN